MSEEMRKKVIFYDSKTPKSLSKNFSLQINTLHNCEPSNDWLTKDKNGIDGRVVRRKPQLNQKYINTQSTRASHNSDSNIGMLWQNLKHAV